MKLLIDLLPVIAFFAAYKLGKVMPADAERWVTALFGPMQSSAAFPDLVAVVFATAVAIAVTLVTVGWMLARREPVKPMLWVSAVLIVAFGGLTIWLQNEWFIKWKPSLLYWTFAVVLAGGQLFGRNLLGTLMGSEVDLPRAIWDRLLWWWAGFFAFLGIANLAAAYSLSTEHWVDFKTFGLMGLTFAFALGMGFYMARHMRTDAPAEGAAAPEQRDG